MELTPESLKDLAATAVAGANNGLTLNDSITKIAMDSQMNSDQLARLVETTNQVAYLSKLASADDRTVEFEVAKYDDILDAVISEPSMDKQASETKGMSPLSLVASKFEEPMEKVASELSATESMSKDQKLMALKKVASHQRVHLDNLVNAENDHLVKLAQHRAIICRDPEALEKMASFDNGVEMAKLVFGHNKVASDVRKVWSEADMYDVKALSNRLDMIKSASEEIKELTPKVEEAEGMLKQAFVGAIAGTLARSTVGTAVRGAVSNVAKSGLGSKLKGSAGALKNAGKKAFNAGEAYEGIKEVEKGTKRNFNAWSSIRG